MPANTQDVINALNNPNISSLPANQQAQASREINMNPGQPLLSAANSPASFGGQFGSASGNADYASNFGTALQQLLQKAQQLGTSTQSKLTTGALNYSDAGINAQNAQLTNPALQGYNPSTIMGAGNAAIKPFDTASAGLNQVGSTFNEQLSNFGNVLDNAKNIMDTYTANQAKAKSDAQTIIQTAISAGGDAIATLIKNQPDLVKLSGFDVNTLQSIADASKQQATTYQTEDVGGQKVRFGFDKNGNIISRTVLGSSGTGGGIGGGTSTTTPNPIVDPVTDAAVATIIQNNPGEYGHAADAIDAQFGKGTATKYDSWLKSVYLQGQNINNIYQPADYGGLSGINLSRITSSANRIVSNYVNSGTYKVVSEGAPYLSRIGAAVSNPGSVGDAELLDSVVKLNTGGNQVTDTQVRTITGGRSLSDSVNVWTNKLKNGGVLSDSQRKQLAQVANLTYQKYLQDYQPIYNQATAQLKAAGIPQQFWTIPNWNTLVGQMQTNNSSGSSGTTSGGNSYTITP